MSWWLSTVTLLVLVQNSICSEIFKNKDCAIVLSSAGAVVTGRDVCLRYEDVEEAFSLAKEKVGLRFPARQVTDLSIAQLGTALQETSRIIARRFWLSRWEVENVLPRLDTSGTAIGRYCAWPLRRTTASCPQERYRRADATCNNLLDPTRGAANLPFKRLLPPLYADRISEPRVARDGSPLPLERLVSTRVHADISKRHDLRVSFMFPAWGQLVDHDLTLTAETKDPETRKELDCCEGGTSRHPNCYPLQVPWEDPFYKDKKQTCLNLARSLAGVRPGCALGSRTQINLNTAYIDANFIYGSDKKLAESLRLLQKGQLKTFDAFPELGLKPILPPKTKQPDDGCLRPHPDIYCFLAGDNRVNEQLALGVLHTLTAREHNRIATELSYINPHWDDEKLYQETRHIMAAIVQHITYNEFLPQLLGEHFVKQYDLKLNPEGYQFNYDPEVDPTIPASFGTAAFRFGHSLLPNTMQRRSSNHKLTGERKLSEMLQQPFDLYKPGWVDAYVLGLVNQISQPMDHSVTAEVTNHLFQEPARDFGRDLAAINLARAREHGIPGYMAYRKHCGLDDMDTWQDMWSFLPNSTVSEYLKVYDDPDDVDLWSAGVSELPAPGSMLGPVFSCIIATTFRDLKKGDRFWYENPGFVSSFTLRQLKEIKKYSLARLICNAGDNIETIQMKVMLLPDYDENPRVSCKTDEIPDINLHYWKESLTYDEEQQEYPAEPPLITSSNNKGYLPPITYKPWSVTSENVPSKYKLPDSYESDLEKEVPPEYSEGENSEKFTEQYFLNPLNLDDLSPPFPDLFDIKDKYAISEESYYGIVPEEKPESVEENESLKIEKLSNTDYGYLPPTEVQDNPVKDILNDGYTPSYEKLQTSHGTTQHPTTKKLDLVEQPPVQDHTYFLNNKKYTSNSEGYPDHKQTTPSTITNHSAQEALNYDATDKENGYDTDKYDHRIPIHTGLVPPPEDKPIDTSLVPPHYEKQNFSSIIENVNELIEKYGNQNHSQTEKTHEGYSYSDHAEDVKISYDKATEECLTAGIEKEISITSTPAYIQDSYLIPEITTKPVNFEEEEYTILKPPEKELERIEAKSIVKTLTEFIPNETDSSTSEAKENIQINVIKNDNLE
ncbi:myeloperoxidase [Halyomorpha halys]|uniref:myeloperoxidase n=1 Tax=Halyomorpha halys TaxID=286706 RepID=UPI0034D35E53